MNFSTILICILIATSTALFGVHWLWAITLQRHWFLRTAIVGAGLFLLLLIPAYELFVAYGVQAAVIAAAHSTRQLVRRRKNEQSNAPPKHRLRSRFSLQTLMLVLVMVSVIVAAGNSLPKLGSFTWIFTACIGFQAGIQTLTAAWLVDGKARFGWRIAAALLVPLALILLTALLNFVIQWWNDAYYYSPPFGEDVAIFFNIRSNHPYHLETTSSSWPYATIVICLATVGISAVSIWLWRICLLHNSGRANPSDPQSRHAVGIRRGYLLSFLCIWFLAIAAFPVWTYRHMVLLPPLPNVELPKPNAYDTFLAASRRLPDPVELDPKSVSPDALRKEVLTYQPAFDLMKIAFVQQCLRPLHYNEDDITTTALMSIRELGRAARNAAYAAVADKDYEKAAKYHLDSVRLGTSMKRGGLMIDALVGFAIESLALRELHPIVPHLSNAERSRAVHTLWEADRDAEPADEFIRRDIIWSNYSFGWQNRLELVIHQFDQEPSDNFTSFIRSSARHQTLRRLLIVHLAISMYQSDHGVPPNQLTELVPDYLPALPLDPFGNKPFIYQRNADKFSLYSIGSNGDITLDSLLEEP